MHTDLKLTGNAHPRILRNARVEYRTRQFLREGRTVNLFRLRGHISSQDNSVVYDDYSTTRSGTDKMLVVLDQLEEVFLDPEVDAVKIGGSYHRPLTYNSPAPNSWHPAQPDSGLSPLFLGLQTTRNKTKHDVTKVGLNRAEKKAPAGCIKLLIVVTPPGLEPEIFVPREYLTDEYLDNQDPSIALPVYHFPVTEDLLF